MARSHPNMRYIISILILGLFCVACAADEEAGSAGENEEFVLEAQSAAEATATPLPSPTATPLAPPATPTPVPTLMTELVEPVSPVSPGDTTMANIPADLIIPGSEAAIQAAIDDLAAQLAISPADISLVAVEAQDWRDASLGCPEEGMMYAQVITPGFLITLEANGQQYAYHTDQQANVVLCEQ